MDEEMNVGELLREVAEENQTRKILKSSMSVKA
jgi:hypothetical protein